MTDRFAVLDDIDALLQDATDQTITESLERGESPEHGDPAELECRWCGHGWHGLPCTPGYDCDCVFCRASANCGCESSLTSRDDSWRPPGQPWAVERLMHDEGLDGWAAYATLRRPRRESARYATVSITVDVSQVLAAFARGGACRTRPAAPVPASTSWWNEVCVIRFTSGLPEALAAGPAPELTPRERALAARRNRNTGPARPAAAQTRRPRNHGAAR